MNGLEKGKKLFEKQEFNEAIIILTSFLEGQANNADALYTRAMCYRKIEQYDNSITDLTTILKRLPEEATLFCDRGISHFKNNNIEAALADMNKAVELEPENHFRYSSRAYIKAKTDIDGAMTDYEKAIELDPKDEISYNNLGLLQENAGRMNAAKKNYSKGNEIIGYNPDDRREDLGKSSEEKEKVNNEEIQNDNSQESQNSLGKMMLSVFTSKKVRQEYYQFLKSTFKK